MQDESAVTGIQVKFLYVLSSAAHREFYIELEGDTKLTVGQVIDHLRNEGHLPAADVDLARRALVLVNGNPILYDQGWETQVNATDEISFVAPLAGG